MYFLGVEPSEETPDRDSDTSETQLSLATETDPDPRDYQKGLTENNPFDTNDSEVSDRLLEAQKKLHELMKQRTAGLQKLDAERAAFLRPLDAQIRQVGEEIAAALAAALDAPEEVAIDPNLISGPAKRRVTYYLGQQGRWTEVGEISAATGLSADQTIVCLRNGRAKHQLFDLEGGRWRLAPLGKDAYRLLLELSKT